MNDYDKLKKLFAEFGIGFIEWDPKITQIAGKSVNTKEIYLEAGQNKVEGYSGFYSNFIFDENGNFIKVENAE